MGLSDRDYARQPPRRSAFGRLPPMSVNTWLIIINVAIFFVGALFLSAPKFYRPVETNRVSIDSPTVTQTMIEQASTDRTRMLSARLTGEPGYPMYYNGQFIGIRVVMMRPMLDAYGHFSTASGFFGLEVWRFVTFQFLHANLTHLLFNMMGLYFVGAIVEQFLGGRRYLAFYLTCGIFGAVLYLALNFLGAMLGPSLGRIPGLLFDDIHTPLVGASAGIFGVLMAAAFIAPNAQILVMFAIPMRLKNAVYAFTVIAFVQLVLGSSNAGGEAAHLGGAFAGFFFIRRMHLLRDFFDVFGDSRPPRTPPGSRAPRQASWGTVPPPPLARIGPPQSEVDRLLAKVASTGLASLSESEQATLRAATEAKRRG